MMSSMCPEWADGRRLPQGKQTGTIKIYYLAHHGSVRYFLDTEFLGQKNGLWLP